MTSSNIPMVATHTYICKSSHSSDSTEMAGILTSSGNGCSQRNSRVHCKKDILVKSNDTSDIVEKFIKVAHGPEALENNRARENARENIRKKLAMEAAKEKTDSCDLQICFMNEFASDDELSEKEDFESVAVAGEEIAKANISQKVSQIIVPLPLAPPAPQDDQSSNTNPTQSDPNYKFKSEVGRLQECVREGLMRAREEAKLDIQDQINTRHQNNEKLFLLLGLPQFSKLTRRTISKLNVAQLQLIQNDYLAQIQTLNEELVSLLVAKDELVMEQDAMLTDIEDLSEFVNLKK